MGGLAIIHALLIRDTQDSGNGQWMLFPRGRTLAEDHDWTGEHSWTCIDFSVVASNDILLSAADAITLEAAGNMALDVDGFLRSNAIGGASFSSLAAGLPAAPSPGSVDFRADDRVRMIVNGTEWFRVTNVGSWQANGASGNRGDELMSQGSGSPTVWSPRSTSLVTSLVTTTNSNTPVTIASRVLPANEPVAGTVWKFSAQLRVERGATATATNVRLAFRVGGSDRLFVQVALNTTNGYSGTVRIEGEIVFHSAAGATASYTVAGFAMDTVTTSTPVLLLPTPSLAFTADTTAPLTLDIRANFTTAVAGASFTPLSAIITRVIN
jgi:hypothetical protein